MWVFSDNADKPDPNKDKDNELVNELRASYPYDHERIGVVSAIRLIVYTVLELKRRGLI